MKREMLSNGKAPQLPPVWEYTDYRSWLTDTFQARKAIHSWYSYGVLAQRAGFRARDYLLRVMRGEKKLSIEGAARLAEALDLSGHEHEYFIALVQYNQSKKDAEKDSAWRRVQTILSKSRGGSKPRRITGIHRDILAESYHLALRSYLEMRPTGDDWEGLAKRLLPSRTPSAIRRSMKLLQQGGLVEKLADGLWHTTDKSLSIPPDVGGPALRSFHRDCLQLAEKSLETVSVQERHLSGLTLGISPQTYELFCQRLQELHLEFGQLADLDEKADQVYHLSLSLFPMTRRAPEEST